MDVAYIMPVAGSTAREGPTKEVPIIVLSPVEGLIEINLALNASVPKRVPLPGSANASKVKDEKVKPVIVKITKVNANRKKNLVNFMSF